MNFNIQEVHERIRFLTKKGCSVVLINRFNTIKVIIKDSLFDARKYKNVLGVYNNEISDEDLREDLEYLKGI